jgi:hypothetical protein
MSKPKQNFPDKFIKKLSIDEWEFTKYCAYLIELFRQGRLHDQADKMGVHRENINSLARLGLMLEKARAELYVIDQRKTQSEEYLSQIQANKNSEKSYIVLGPKMSNLEQVLVLAMSVFPGLSMGKMIATVLPVPILATIIGLTFGGSFFWLGEKFLLNAWKEVVFAPQLSPIQEKKLIKRALSLSTVFVVADGLITGLSMVLTSIPDGGSIDILSWCWLIFSLVTSIIMCFILHYCATKNKYAIRRVLEQYREVGGVAVEKINHEYRHERQEEKKLKRLIKELAEDVKILSQWMIPNEKIRSILTMEIFGVEYLERAGVTAFQTATWETPQKFQLSEPGANMAKHLSSEYPQDNKPQLPQQNSSSKEKTESQVRDIHDSHVDEKPEDETDAQLF